MDAVEDGGDASRETLRLFTRDTAIASSERPDLGRYLAIEVLGQGAHGSVVRAYDAKLHREVAVKRLSPGALGENARQRLVREAQAMAQLSHPNVVSVHDVEGDGDEVVLVMELVAGMTLRDWLRARERDRHEIVDKLVLAGRGLAAAHRAGLVHRDFKPSNVLVSSEGEVKVTDFGLAKAAMLIDESSSSRASDVERSSALDASSLAADLTGDAVVVGTPRYMAPEQHRGAPIGPAADQFAWAVALWESLVGAPPFAGHAGRELLLEKQAGPPPWPRHVPMPRALVDIVRRALAPKPEDRWSSMDLLLRAIERAERGRRIRWSLGAAALVAGGVVAAATARQDDAPCSEGDAALADVWSASQREAVPDAIEATGLAIASDTAVRVQRRLDRYRLDWLTGYYDACAATSIRGEQSHEVMQLRLRCLQDARYALEAAIELLRAPDDETVRRALSMLDELPAIERCADPKALRSAPTSLTPQNAELLDGIGHEIAHARLARGAGKYDRGLEHVASARALMSSLNEPELAAEIGLLRGELLERTGEYEDAKREIDDALKTALEHEALGLAARAAAADSLVTGERLSRPAEGIQLAELALALARGQDRTGLLEAQARSYLAIVHSADGRPERAIEELSIALELRENAVGSDDPLVATALHNLGAARLVTGAADAAAADLRRAIAIRESALGTRHPEVGGSRTNLGEALRRLGRLEAAEREHRLALEIMRDAYREAHPLVGSSLNNLANVLADRGQLAEAEAAYREAQEIWTDALGPAHPRVVKAMINLASIQQERGNPAAARATLEAVLERASDPTYAATIPEVEVRILLAESAAAAGDHEAAIAELGRAQALGVADAAATAKIAAGLERSHAALAQSPGAPVMRGR